MVVDAKNSDIIALFLKEKQIDTVFGVIGSANSYIFDSISKLGYTNIINVHHEQTAVMAAGSYFRVSGKLSVAIVTAGAGASNAVTGVISNWADSIPCIIISGQEQTHFLVNHSSLRMYGTQGYDAQKMVQDVTKYHICLDKNSNMQEVLEHSYAMSLNGRPGPTWIDIPMDVQSSSSGLGPWSNFARNAINIELADVQIISDLLKSSSRPLILGGHGIKLAEAGNEFKKFVEINNIPTLLTWSGIDLLSSDHPCFYGRPGLYGQRSANFILQNCDLLIVLGSRLALPQVGYDFADFARHAKIVVVDIDEKELTKYSSRYYKTFCKDVGSILACLNQLDCTPLNISNWVEYCNQSRLSYPWVDSYHEDNGYINAYKFIDKLSSVLKDDCIITTDMGTALLCGHQAIKLKSTQKMFTSLGLGEMGYGLPGAIGASFASPGKDIICLNCDGGIMMNIQELQTIVNYKLPIKIIIFNNDGYLMIKHTQKMLFKGHYVSVNENTGLGLPNFSKVLPAFGFKYLELKTWERFDDVVQEFVHSSSPSVLEVFMDPEQDFIPKVKGVVKDDGTFLPPPLEEMSPLLPLNEIKDQMLVELSKKSVTIKR